MPPKIDVPETMLERMKPEDRMYKSVAEMLIHQFESEPSIGIITTGNPTDTVRKELLRRRFREFSQQQFPDLDSYRLWRWYFWYLVQTGRYTVREDRGYGVARFIGYDNTTPRMKYQYTSQHQPRPQRLKASDLVEYTLESKPGMNGYHELGGAD